MSRIPLTLTTKPELRAPLLGWGVALGVLSHQVATGHAVWWDQLAASGVATLRSPALDGPAHLVAWFGSSAWTVLVLAGLSVVAWRRRGVAAAVILLMAFALSVGMEAVLRLTVPHWRPDTVTVPATMSLGMRFALTGFPSGHAIRSAFVFGWMSRESRELPAPWARLVRAGCLLMIGLVGFTRLYLNRHWVSDVLSGWLVVLVACAIARCWEQAVLRRP